jgi:hypothetical protein
MLVVPFCVLCFFTVTVKAQQKATPAPAGQDKSSLSSENLDLENKNLDQIIKDLNDKIQGVFQKYKLAENKDIKIIPYQVDFIEGDGFILVERHMFLRDNMDVKVTGEKRKSMKFYVSGGNLSKVESTVYERDYNSASLLIVEVTDPTPLTEGTDDVTIKQTYRGKVLFSKTLGELKNTTAFPVRIDFKRGFYIPHLTYFYETILSIAETYSKNAKDTDSSVSEFLKSSTDY